MTAPAPPAPAPARVPAPGPAPAAAGPPGGPAVVGVLGCGLLGTSVALRLREAGVDVLLDDADDAAVATAVQVGAGRPWEAGGRPVDVAVVAVPPRTTGPAAVALLRDGRAGVVTDVASVKVAVQADVDTAPDVSSRFCGGHPMAGRERGGALRARADLFDGRPWVSAPVRSTSRAARDAVTWLVQTCGADLVRSDPVRHDAAVALVSHLPQLVASAVAARLAGTTDQARSLAGQGLRDTVRVAGSDPALWGEVVTANAAQVAVPLRALRDDLDELLAALEAADGPGDAATTGAVVDLVARGRLGRASLPARSGPASGSRTSVSVVVDDSPGRLAGLLADAAAAGVNVADLSIDHAPGRARGVVELVVTQEQAGGLAVALRDAGWAVPVGEGRAGSVGPP